MNIKSTYIMKLIICLNSYISMSKILLETTCQKIGLISTEFLTGYIFLLNFPTMLISLDQEIEMLM